MLEKTIEAQRAYFKTDITLNVNFRLGYLKKLKAAIKTREKTIVAALKSDLGKSAEESYMSEIGMVLEDLS